MSRAPPRQTQLANELPPHVQSNMHLASAMGAHQLPSVVVQSPLATQMTNDPTGMYTIPVHYNTPMQYETQHIPVVDFKAGVNPIVSTPYVPQQLISNPVLTQNAYGIQNTPSTHEFGKTQTNSELSSDYMKLVSARLNNIEDKIYSQSASASTGDSYGGRMFERADQRPMPIRGLYPHRNHGYPHHHYHHPGGHHPADPWGDEPRAPRGMGESFRPSDDNTRRRGLLSSLLEPPRPSRGLWR